MILASKNALLLVHKLFFASVTNVLSFSTILQYNTTKKGIQ